MTKETDDASLALTAAIVASYLSSGSHVKAEEIPDLIRSVRAALNEQGSTPAEDAPASAAPKLDKRAINRSITPDALISFLDGKPYKTLKRHLGRHGHDMKSYRAAYGLPSDYPSVAPNYSAARSAMAKQIGLGALSRKKDAAPVPASSPEPPAAKKGGRRKKA